MQISTQTKLWGCCHVSLIALASALASCAPMPKPEPAPPYKLCTPVPPATDCGDPVNIKVN